ncbi:60S ribosomal protein L10 [Dionaea muscipula]
MDATLCLLSSNPIIPSKLLSLTPPYPTPLLTHKSHFLHCPNRAGHHRGQLSIRAAVSRTKKEETVETVKKHLKDCYLLAAIGYKGMTVKQFQDLRRSLPENTSLIVAKNTLVFKAIENTKWEALEPCMKGMNAWLFVHTEEIQGVLKPYRNFQKENKLEENDFTGACFEGKFYGPQDFEVLETMPSRVEVYARILGALKNPATALVGTLKAPARDLLLLLKAYVKKLEDEGAQ